MRAHPCFRLALLRDCMRSGFQKVVRFAVGSIRGFSNLIPMSRD